MHCRLSSRAHHANGLDELLLLLDVVALEVRNRNHIASDLLIHSQIVIVVILAWLGNRHRDIASNYWLIAHHRIRICIH
jgi:hypothetical protein